MKLTLAVVALLAVAGGACAQQPYVDPGMNKIAQVAIVCKDIEVCSQRWAKLLGQTPAPIRTTLPGREVQAMYRGKPSDGQIKLTFFKTGDATLELMQPVGTPDTSWREHLDKYGEGLHHIAFMVQDLEKTLESLKQQGMPVIHRGRWDSKDGDYVYVDSYKHLGVLVEILHRDQK